MRLERALSDEFMAFLALLTILITVAPYAFSLTPSLLLMLVVVEVLIVLLFIVEYCSGLALSTDKRAFLVNPWRALDAFIIVGVLVSLLPLPTDLLGIAPALRLLRLVRVAVLGTRTGARLSVKTAAEGDFAAKPVVPVEAYALVLEDQKARFFSIPYEEALTRISSADNDWLYLSGLDKHHVSSVAESLNVPDRLLQNRLFDAAFPRIDQIEHYSTLFTWYPSLNETPTGISVERTGLLLIGSGQNVAVLARGSADLTALLERQISLGDHSESLLVRATQGLIREVIQSYQRVVEYLETSLIRIESVEPSLRDRDFLTRTFQLRGEISRVRTTLRHLTVVTRTLKSRRLTIQGFEANMPQLQILAGEASDLYDRVDDVNTNLTALVDMRLNISSFQMNKVMRLLAILTTLALIPAVVGGMFGMNLSDNPWPLSMSEVAFWVGSGMLFSLYLFAIKGWFR